MNTGGRAMVVGGAVLVAGALLWRVACRDQAGLTPTVVRRIAIDCGVPGITLWLDGIPQASPELPIPIPAQGCLVRVSHPDYVAWSQRIDASRIDDTGSALRVQLARPARGRSTISVSSSPPSAEVWLDGVKVGKTPLRLDGLMPGTHSVSFQMAGRGSVRRSVALRPSGDPTPVHVYLPSHLVSHYRAMVGREPARLGSYADLAHQYIIDGESEAAVDALMAAVAQLAQHPEADFARLWTELEHILKGQHVAAQAVGAVGIQKALDSRLRQVCAPEVCDLPHLCEAYAVLVSRVGRVHEARRIRAAARRKFGRNSNARRSR